MAGKSEEHRKLGKVVDSNLNAFALRLRMPDWRPDEIVHNDGAGKKEIEVLYLEEALRASRDANGMITKDAFQPPLGSAPPAWILGGQLKPKPNDEFDAWLVDLCNHIRNYNRALYRLRKLHLAVELNADEMDPLPDDTIPPGMAERDWTGKVTALRAHLDNPFGQTCIVNMIEVNGYIVSLRAIGPIFIGREMDKKGNNRTLGPQPGGSSSSHISISSCFSSPK